MNNKGFANFIILIIAAVAVLGSGVFYVYKNQLSQQSGTEQQSTPTADQINANSQNEIADWKKYRNEEYGFEFQYPINLDIKADTSAQVFSLVLADAKIATTPPQFIYLSVVPSKFTDISAYQKYQESRTKNIFSKTTISGVPALVAQFAASSDKEIIIIHDKLMYQFGGNLVLDGYNLDTFTKNFALFPRKLGETKIEQKASSDAAIMNAKLKNAQIKMDISNLSVVVETYYDKHNGFGIQGKTAGQCSGSGAPPMFVDVSVASYLKITPRAQCNVSASGDEYAVIAQLLDEGDGVMYWCADSLGFPYLVSKGFAIGALSCPQEINQNSQ